MILKKDNIRLGLVLGLLTPLLSITIYYFAKFYPLYSLGDMLDAMRTNKRVVTAITIPCLFVNILLFTIYINYRKDKTAKGIFASTLIYAIAALVFKFAF
ncbi:MAG: hypothetical protein ACTHLE_02500 [Agriterribacter sp.]